jgi:hypothetical protein
MITLLTPGQINHTYAHHLQFRRVSLSLTADLVLSLLESCCRHTTSPCRLGAGAFSVGTPNVGDVHFANRARAPLIRGGLNPTVKDKYISSATYSN